MKTIYLFILICLTGTFLVSCNKDKKDESTTTNPTVETTPYTAGQILTYAFIVDEDTVVKMRDQVLDYGLTNFPVLMLVHKETLIQKAGWGSVFHPLRKEKLDTILELWARQFNMNYVTPHEKALVARNFLDFIVSHNLDVGLFVDLILWNHGSKFGPVIEIISAAEKKGRSPNECLYSMTYDNIPPEKMLNELKSNEQLMEFAVMMIFAHIVETGTKLIEIFLGNQAVVDYPENYLSYVCSNDTVLSDYTAGTSFISREYKLSYDVGLWEAKCHYHLEGTYAAHSPACSGTYITHCNTIPDYAHAKGPGFIVEGKVSYSPPINRGTDVAPVPELNGKVMVTYGDCCCFRKFSILNFKINADSGYKETTFDYGKKAALLR